LDFSLCCYFTGKEMRPILLDGWPSGAQPLSTNSVQWTLHVISVFFCTGMQVVNVLVFLTIYMVSIFFC
jgi:hypothetical protein